MGAAVQIQNIREPFLLRLESLDARAGCQIEDTQLAVALLFIGETSMWT